jgi:hypothetical protein
VPEALRPRPAKLSKTIRARLFQIADQVSEDADEHRLLYEASGRLSSSVPHGPE